MFALAATLPAAAQAAPVHKARYSTETLCEIVQPCLPPAQYARGPFLARPAIKLMSLERIQSACADGFAMRGTLPESARSVQAAVSMGADLGTLGCAQVQATQCEVFLPSDLRRVLPQLYSLVLTHELGHCRGWVHDRYS